jgi:transposase
VSERHVYNAKKLYAEQGIAGIKPKTRGRRKGEKRSLTPEQEREIQKIIVDKTPEQMRFKECMGATSNPRTLILENTKSI